MKRAIIYYFLILLFSACTDDENKTLDPTDKDVDWFAIQPSSDEIDNLRYEIYRDTKISVFYSDTIGKEYRGIDSYGDSIIHYEILTPYYSMSSAVQTITYSLSRDRGAIKSGISFIRDYVIDKLDEKAYPRSFLLVEDLTLKANASASNGRREGNVYKGLATTLVSHVSSFGTLTETEKKELASEVAAPIWYDYLIKQDASLFNDFCAVSLTSVVSVTKIYDVQVTTFASSALPYSTSLWNAYGFLISNPERALGKNTMTGQITSFYTPTEEQDIVSFIQAVLNYSEVEFQTLYKEKEGYGYLLEKFGMMKDILNAYKN